MSEPEGRTTGVQIESRSHWRGLVVTYRERSEQASFALAEEAVDRLCDEPDAVEIYEPEDRRTVRVAVLRLRKRFDEVPKFIAEALDGARSSGELLSDDRLQGLSEISRGQG